MPTPTATMYLRNMPSRLVREAKSAAARQGTTLTAVVQQALERYLADNPDARPDELEPLAKEMTWYEANKRKLLRRYAGEYVAIIDGKVVDHDQEFSSLAQRVFNRYGVRAIFMPKVVAEERVVNLPSPHMAR
jgi:hypothetical protein